MADFHGKEERSAISSKEVSLEAARRRCLLHLSQIRHVDF